MQVKDRTTKMLLLFFLMPQSYFSPVALTDDILPHFDLTFNHKTKGTLSGMLGNNFIKRAADQHTYQLTDKGYEQLCLEFPFLRGIKYQWDGTWRVISYEIPEKKRDLRDRLRRSMRGWGLGPWHRSFWLTPHPIIENLRELVFGKEEEKYIHAFESTHIFGSVHELVEKVWGKSQLERRYRALLQEWHGLLTSPMSGREKFRTVVSSYVDTLRDDPGLPKNIVGEKWIGFEALSLFHDIKHLLLTSRG